jgi:hypothetical protein
MKDFTVQQQKREIKYLAGSFLVAICINFFSIFFYHTEFRELYTQYKPVLILTAIFYCVTVAVRIVFCLFFRRNKSH